MVLVLEFVPNGIIMIFSNDSNYILYQHVWSRGEKKPYAMRACQTLEPDVARTLRSTK